MIFERDVQTEVARYLVRCFLAGRSPHIGELAGQLGINPLALSRRFLRVTGRKLGAFFRMQQVLRARRLLRWPNLSLPEVARASGYEHEKTFYRAFRRTTGMTPLGFREKAMPIQWRRRCQCRIACYVEPSAGWTRAARDF